MKRIIFIIVIIPTLTIANILLVDDDGSNGGYYSDVEEFYKYALSQNNYPYNYYEVPYNAQGPDINVLNKYSTVIWFTGQTFGSGYCTTLSPADENNLKIYLSNGKNLMIVSQDYLSDRYPGAGSFSSGQFPYDILQIRSVNANYWTNPPQAWGASGSIAQGMTFNVTNPYKTPGRIQPDLLNHVATTLIYNSPQNTGPSCLQYNSGTYKLVFMTMAFEGFNEESKRKELIKRIIQFFGENVGIETNSIGMIRAILK